ncbi:D-threonine aldolase [Kluyvera cryocrescens]|uniref:D-threonine aldolase n=1 Tax=Kluyvera cryocrescens TaxID=580 RepID=A0A485BGV7_KLUCR|nr:D-threonine aldolase [Kluyvera cryocrescens]
MPIREGVSLAPHGKTTMTPWIFLQQQQVGAWAIGVGSAWQASVAMASGIQRVLMANQLVGKANMQLISELKNQYPQVDYLCCVDSIDNAHALSAFFASKNQTLDILLELGVPGGRCGCRTAEQARVLAEAISHLSALRLRAWSFTKACYTAITRSLKSKRCCARPPRWPVSLSATSKASLF